MYLKSCSVGLMFYISIGDLWGISKVNVMNAHLLSNVPLNTLGLKKIFDIRHRGGGGFWGIAPFVK